MSRVIVDSALYRHGVREVRPRTAPTTSPTRRARQRRRLRLGRAARPDGGRARQGRRGVRAAPAGRRGRPQRPPAAQARASTTTRCSSSSRRSGTTRTTPAVETGEIDAVRRRRRSSSPSGTARAGRCTTSRKRLEAQHDAARPRPVGGRLRRRATGSSTTTTTSPLALEEDVDEVETVGLLRRAHQRRGAHLHPQARGPRVPPRGAAAARADEPARHRRGAARARADARRSSATSPTTSIRVAEQVEGLDDLLHLGARRAPGPGQRPAERGHAQDLRLGRPSPPCRPLIAGIYGMNFDHMPELRWTLRLPGRAGR